MSQRARSEAESGNGSRDQHANADVRSVKRIGALTDAELAELSTPKRGIASGAFRKDGRPDLSALKPDAPQLSAAASTAFTGKPPAADAERAELHIGDIGMHVANPYLGSSLLPPPPARRPWLRPLLATLAGVTLLSAGYIGALYNQNKVAPAARAATVQASTTEHIHAKPEAHVAPRVEPLRASDFATPTETTMTAAPSVTQPIGAVATPVAAESAKVAPVKMTRAARRAARARARRANRAATAAVASPVTVIATAATNPVASEVATADERPAQLTREQVKNGIETTRSTLQQCAAGAHGQIMANVTISGAGRVTHAAIEGDFIGTAAGSCMARALRGAQFPQFSSQVIRVRYPFAF